MKTTRKALEARNYRVRKGEELARALRDAARAKEALRRAHITPLSPEQVEWREEWLAAAADLAYPVFADRGYALPHKLRVALGWPRNRNWCGVCYAPSASTTGYTEIFISPVLAEPVAVFDILVHELCHAAVGPEYLHRAPFVRCARDLDLCGRPAAAEGQGNPAWHEWADPLIAKLGSFPHDAMEHPGTQAAAQRSRNLLRTCNACGFPMRTTQKWLGQAAALRCPLPTCSGVLV